MPETAIKDWRISCDGDRIQKIREQFCKKWTNSEATEENYWKSQS